MNPILLNKVVEQLRYILSEGEFDTREIAAAATKAASMMRKGEIEVDWLEEYKAMNSNLTNERRSEQC
jgi:hypothetical protein